MEMVSALERRTREGLIDRSQRRRALDVFERLFDAWHEVTDMLLVRGRAEAVLAREPVRAADACQIGSALLVADGDPSFLDFVSLDRRLSDVAEREGFRVLTWSG